MPAVVFAAAAAWNRLEVLRDNEETITRTTAILHEHARKVFDTVELAIGRVEDRTHAMSWEEIAAPETSVFLQRLKAPLEQAVSIWITDATGHVRAGSQPWDPNVTIDEREFFQAQRGRDAGMGMDAATLARAIEPFFTTKGVGKGTGLGLSMIHGLAVQSGGTLTLKSQVGKGTTAEIWLPQGEAVVEAAVSDEQARPEHRTCTVLLVEDDPLVMTATAATLEDLGHAVVEASSAEAALRVLREGTAIDLVVTDHAMPGMTGLELAERIRAEWPTLPILLASGHAELPERSGLSIPRLAKPFRRDELEQAIASLVTPACEPVNVVPFRKP
ncbi:response regulator [Microvirga tunisiensis]|uniref:response regulator n=1 Tax=Microvirga tunisiensis TaxID=2108360 RepID=UPI0030B90E53